MKLTEFFQSHRDEICEKYLKPIGEAKSKKDLADLMDINVCEWLCQMNAKHGGIGRWLTDNFGNFINGRFITDTNGYTTVIYVKMNHFEKEFPLASTVTAFIDCDVKLLVRKNEVRRIVCSNCHINALVEENAELLIVHDGHCEITVDKQENAKFKIKEL